MIFCTLPLAQNISPENQFHSVFTLGQDLQILYPFFSTQLHLRSRWYIMLPNTCLLANQRLIIKINNHWTCTLEVHNGYSLLLYESGSWHNMSLEDVLNKLILTIQSVWTLSWSRVVFSLSWGFLSQMQIKGEHHYHLFRNHSCHLMSP